MKFRKILKEVQKEAQKEDQVEDLKGDQEGPDHSLEENKYKQDGGDEKENFSNFQPIGGSFVRSDEINSCDCENGIQCMNCRRKKLFGNSGKMSLPLPISFPTQNGLELSTTFGKPNNFT